MKTARLLTLTTLLTSLLMMAACGDDGEDVIVNRNNPTTGSSVNENRNTTGPAEARYRMEFPKLKGGNNVVVVHKAIVNKNNKDKDINYCVEWDPDINAQRWSCYQMYSSVNYHSTYNVTRYYASNDGSLSASCQYPNDQDLPPQLQMMADPYKNNSQSLDHGHICPSADRLRAEDANYQTFFITNMQPQYKNFNGSNNDGNINNRSPWYRLEMQVRTWTAAFDTLYVCKGGTIDKGQTLGTLKEKTYGKDIIPIPKYFFVALCGKKGNSYKAIGFWMEHVASYTDRKPLSNYAYSIDELEAKTGIDFFCNLPDDIENQVEKAYKASDWSGNLQ